MSIFRKRTGHSLVTPFVVLAFVSLMEVKTQAADTKYFNPSIGANFLTLGRYSNQGKEVGEEGENGFSLQEAEVQFSSDVDVYFRANALFSVAREEGEWGIDPEEVYAETISLPSVTLKVGKFKTVLGKHNQLHTHAFPFIDPPLYQEELVGEEGLNEAGLSASVLLPTSWFSEFTMQVMGGENDLLFNSPHANDLAGIGRFRNLWDLNDDLTLEHAVSAAAGKNAFDGTSSALGTDLTVKWRPSEGGKYHALAWTTEYLEATRPHDPNGTRRGGLGTWLQYQFAERWWVQGRYELMGIPRSDGEPKENRETFLIGFFPSEFSGLRLQYERHHDGVGADNHQIALQLNISIGAHPAHSY